MISTFSLLKSQLQKKSNTNPPLSLGYIPIVHNKTNKIPMVASHHSMIHHSSVKSSFLPHDGEEMVTNPFKSGCSSSFSSVFPGLHIFPMVFPHFLRTPSPLPPARPRTSSTKPLKCSPQRAASRSAASIAARRAATPSRVQAMLGVPGRAGHWGNSWMIYGDLMGFYGL